jgi:putrescine transport system permease protein
MNKPDFMGKADFISKTDFMKGSAALSARLKRWLPGRHWAVTGVPYLWLLLFFVAPVLIVLRISFSKPAIAQPPYTDVVAFNDGMLAFTLNIGNYVDVLTKSRYADAYLSSLEIAAISTLLCLLVGYPIAYTIARMNTAARNVFLMLVVLPSWTSLLIRVYAWIGILKNNGLLNNFLLGLGVIDSPSHIMNTNIAVYIGIVYAYLPFMVLPLYSNLVKHDFRLLEASSDLGAKPWTTFLQVTLPLSRAGIIAGSMLVFIPAVGEFVIPELLGGSDTLMIGKSLWSEFFNARNWPMASAVAVVMLLLLIVPIMLFHHYQARDLEGGQ